MKARLWLKYAAYSVLIFGMLFLDKYIDKACIHLAGLTMETTKYYYLRATASTLLCITSGILLGLDTLLAEKKKPGIWKMNWPKFVFLWLPLLYFIVSAFILSLLAMFSSQAQYCLYNLLHVFRILFGYISVTCFNKQDEIFC